MVGVRMQAKAYLAQQISDTCKVQVTSQSYKIGGVPDAQIQELLEI